MPILARGYRTEPIPDRWRRGMVARGFRVVWAGHVRNVPPAPSPRPRPGGGGGGWPMPTFPFPPPPCDDPCVDPPDCTLEDTSVVVDTAIGLAQSMSVSPYKRVAFGLAAIFCRASSESKD